MNKKPGLLFVVSLLAIIVLAVSFNMDFGGNAPVKLPAGINPDDVLYVCPVTAKGAFTQLADGLHAIGRYASLLFAFCYAWYSGKPLSETYSHMSSLRKVLRP